MVRLGRLFSYRVLIMTHLSFVIYIYIHIHCSVDKISAWFSSWFPFKFKPNKTGLWGMTTSVIQQKGLPKDYFVNRKGDSLVSQKWLEKPRVIPQKSATKGLAQKPEKRPRSFRRIDRSDPSDSED